VLTVRAKDELATVLVSVLQSIDAARNFLVETVMDEVKNEGNCHVCFLSRHNLLYVHTAATMLSASTAVFKLNSGYLVVPLASVRESHS